MKATVFSFTRKGARLSKVLEQQGYSTDCYTLNEFLSESPLLKSIETNLSTVVGKAFLDSSLLIFIGACGIAVRSIAPYIRDKQTDPAVICIDEQDRYIIPLLSGHIGGANRVAKNIGLQIKAEPIITTATDINGLIAIDEWAKRNNVVISDMSIAKKVSANLVDGQNVGFASDFEISGEIPEQFSVGSTRNCDVGICISLDESQKPFKTTLNLIPRIAFLGIGCKKGISSEAIEELVLEMLEKNNISIKALAGISSIDIKEGEKGLQEFSSKYDLPSAFYSANELNLLRGEFTSSDFVAEITGVDNVCERAATLLSQGGNLVSKKTVKNGVAAALAFKSWRVIFEE